jgi:hypothetical protein
MSEYVLVHHGVKGMKWGVRKDRKKGVGKRMVDYSPDVIKKAYRDPSKRNSSDFHAKLGRLFRLNKCKTKQDIQDWSENEDARIRDDLHYGKITKDQAKRRSSSLAKETDWALRNMTSDSHMMNMHMRNVRLHNEMHRRALDQFMMQNHINQMHLHMNGVM